MGLSLGLTYTAPSVAIGPLFAAPSAVTAAQTDDTPGDRTIQLTFTAPDPAPNSYEVQRRVDSGSWTTVSSGSTNTTYNYTGLDDGTYQFRARAVYTEGNSPWRTTTPIYAFAQSAEELLITFGDSVLAFNSALASQLITRAVGTYNGVAIAYGDAIVTA